MKQLMQKSRFRGVALIQFPSKAGYYHAGKPIVMYIKYPLSALAMIAGANVQAGSAPSYESVPLHGGTLSFNLPLDFVRVTDKNNGTNVLIEYFPRGQSVANWTRMVTVQAYRGLGSSPASSAEIARQAFYPAVCKIGPIYRDAAEREVRKGFTLSIISDGCASLPAGAYPKALKGAGEQDFIMVFRDANTVYTLNYAERGAPFAGKVPPRDIERSKEILREIFGNVALTAARLK